MMMKCIFVFIQVRKVILYDDKVHFNFANRREEIHMASHNSIALLLNCSVSVL